MRKVKMLENAVPCQVLSRNGEFLLQYRYQRGKSYVVDEATAKKFCKKKYRWDKENGFRKTALAKTTADYGLHYGRSCHSYIRNGESRLFGKNKKRKDGGWNGKGIDTALTENPQGATVSQIQTATGLNRNLIMFHLMDGIQKGSYEMTMYSDRLVVFRLKNRKD